MIVEALLSLIFIPLNALCSLIPDLNFTINVDVFTKFFEIMRVAGYFLPMRTIGTVFTLVVTLILFKSFVALVKLIKGFIPFMGG